ncbi:MAG TPA: sensor histidine kinase, partial [Pyrinomonadaceae bacterium]|nr:sensor histidine kinase [Pyrinomonadaceae bacterium]
AMSLPEPQINFTHFARVTKAASGLAVLVSSLVLLGWTFNLPILRSVLPGQPHMVPHTAVAFILASLSLATLKNKRKFSVICAFAVVVIAVLIISEYITGLDLGFDKLLFSQRLQFIDNSFPGRPSPHTAIDFLLVGIALLLTRTNGRAYRVAPGLALTAALIASMALIGYIYDVAFLYSISSHTGMALHTALIFIALSVGILFVHPEQQLMSFILSDTAGGLMLRHLLPATIVIPIIAGGLILLCARAGFYEMAFAVPLCVVASIVVLTTLIWRNAVALHRSDAKRSQAEDALRNAYNDLEQRVEERTKELSRVNENLQAEIIKHKESETARLQLLRRLVKAQEEERCRISRELHDQTGQHLTALLLGLKTLNNSSGNGSASLHKGLLQLQKLTERLVDETHHLAWELRPAALDDLGLETALSNYVEKWSERSSISLDFHSGLDRLRLPMPVETAVFRIVQEALTNVLKHAQANRVSVMLEYRNDELLVIVEDNGRGFQPGKEREGLGLVGIHERVALVGGKLNIESEPGSGTTLVVRIPAAASSQQKAFAYELAPHFLSR